MWESNRRRMPAGRFTAVIDNVRRPVEAALGARIIEFEALSGGFTQALTGLVDLTDGRRLFLKAGLDEHSAPQVSAEIRNLGWLDASFLPEVIAAIEDPPILVIEDLSAGHWPEPYPEDLQGLEMALEELRSLPVPAGIDLPSLRPPGEEVLSRLLTDASSAVPAVAPWIESNAGLIASAIGSIRPEAVLSHTDLWYSNLCFLQDRVVIIDWSHASFAPSGLDASTVSIDLVIGGRRPLASANPLGWAAAFVAWVVWSLAKGPGPAISRHEAWKSDNLELFDGAAWWMAHEAGIEPPPPLSERKVGW